MRPSSVRRSRCPTSSDPRAPTSAKVRELLRQVPAYLSQGVITRDRKTANLAFGIRLMPLDRQKEVVDDIKDRLDPPEGVSAAVVGLPVLAAEANGALSSPRAPRAHAARRPGRACSSSCWSCGARRARPPCR